MSASGSHHYAGAATSPADGAALSPPARRLAVFRCRACQAVYFPRRSLCAQCGAGGFDEIDGALGRVEQSTVVRHRAGAGSAGGEQHLATVCSAAGPRVIVALAGPLAQGSAVMVLEQQGLLLASPV